MTTLALVIAACLAASPSAAAKKPAASPEEASRLADEAARLAKDAAALAKDAAHAPADAVEADVMGFLSLTNSTASRDGGVKLPWDGPGGMQLKLSWDALEKRNEALAMGDMMARALVEAVRMYFETEGGLDPDAMRAKLVNLTGSPMEEARTAYLDAVTWEERRLFFIERGLELAAQENAALPGVDADLVTKRLRAIRSGAVRKALAAQIEGYRDLALGLVAYLDGDNFRALERVRNAASALPDFAVAHAFLGSMYFLFDQKEAAVQSWRRSYELDPTNESVKAALTEYGRRGKKQAASKR